MSDHEQYMRRCFQLATLGAGTVAPNPMVGSVLVHAGRIIGEGYHQRYGEAHAEVNCFNSVPVSDRHLVAQSILYVSLEPCAHFGKTPPCADRIISEGVKTVVIGCRDPFEAVNGKGIEKLQAAGIQVIDGILEAEARQINKRFFCFHTRKRPYIILKWAQSANHCISGKDRQPVKISGDLANRLVHLWRTEEAGIAVGTNTALTDDPKLTARRWPGPQPVRILLDKHLQVAVDRAIFSADSTTVVFNLLRSGIEGNTRYIQLKENKPVLQQITDGLFTLGIQSLLIEGGAKFLGSFLSAGLWDEARIITNTSLVIEEGYPAPQLLVGRLAETQQLCDDQVQYFYPY